MMRDDASIDDVDDNGVGVSTVQQDLTALVAQLELGKKLDDALSRIHVAINGTPVFEDAVAVVAAGQGKGARSLNSYVTEFGQTHCLAVQFHPGETETLRLPADVSTAIFRAVQEGLANVARHAQATEIVLSLSHEAGKLIVTLADNGVGFDPLSASGPSGVGLAGMRERLETVGGRFAVESGKAGTTLCMQVPLDGEEN